MTTDQFEEMTFTCERCGEDVEDASYQPLCTECYHEAVGSGEIEPEDED